MSQTCHTVTSLFDIPVTSLWHHICDVTATSKWCHGLTGSHPIYAGMQSMKVWKNTTGSLANRRWKRPFRSAHFTSGWSLFLVRTPDLLKGHTFVLNRSKGCSSGSLISVDPTCIQDEESRLQSVLLPIIVFAWKSMTRKNLTPLNSNTIAKRQNCAFHLCSFYSLLWS